MVSAPSGALYEARRKIQPQAVRGRFRTAKWIVLAVTLGLLPRAVPALGPWAGGAVRRRRF